MKAQKVFTAPTTAQEMRQLVREFGYMKRASTARTQVLTIFKEMACEHEYIVLDGNVWRFNGFNCWPLSKEVTHCEECEQKKEVN